MKKIGVLVFIIMMMAVVTAAQAEVRAGGLPPLVIDNSIKDCSCPPCCNVLDSDKDGVPDNLDKCPNTPEGVAVDKDGCPLDSDKDGVPDYLDKCPDTPAGVAVDKDGCPPPVEKKQEAQAPVQEKISIALNVEFDTAKAVVKKKYHDNIKKVADFMKAYPETNAVIEGHTDNIGNEDYNVKLSQDRANSIRQYLIDNFGIDASRLTATGYGPNRPIASNDTEEGRQKNRRVQAVIETVR